jgi:peroxiredoxin family protein
MSERTLGILLVGGDLERAHTALMLAASAASLDRPVVLFATQSGLKALCRDWSGLEGSARDQAFVARGVAGFEALREVLSPLGVRLMACVAGMQAVGLAPDALIGDVAIVGMPSFLEAVGDGQMLSI